MKAITMHVGCRKRGDMQQVEVMTMQNQTQTSSRPKLYHTQTLDHKAQASSTANEPSRDSGVVVVVLLVLCWLAWAALPRDLNQVRKSSLALADLRQQPHATTTMQPILC